MAAPKHESSTQAKPRDARAIAAELFSRLEAGVWKTGSAIPSENDLTVEFGVCRATIVKALKDLERRGLLQSRQGRGRFVSDTPPVKRTGSLGVVLPDIDHLLHPVQAQQLAGIRSVLSQTDYHLKIFALNTAARAQTDGPQGNATLDMLELAGVDGVLLITFRLSEAQVLELAARAPVVWMGHPSLSPRVAGAMHDSAGPMFDAARHLVALGHRSVGLVTLTEQLVQGRDQSAGARLGMRDVIADGKATLAIEHLPSNAPQGGYEAALSLLNRPDRPTAILCGSDDLALGVIKAAAEKKLKIPRDLSIVGWNDVLTPQQTPVPMTTVQQDYFTLAQVCTQRLVDMINQRGQLAEIAPIAGRLIVRQSTARPNAQPVRKKVTA